ncbi:MAG: DUF1351 domain-containing protein [Eubacterium sp.]|nr:DUF1351 domain-containing protein [Eubacterium sp.]
MELQIYNPTAENIIKSVDWNFEELKQEITTKAADYKMMVYTEETIKDAKKDRANLNKFIKALEDKRKEVKKMMLEPYQQFEGQVKELVAIIGDANMNIDSQVKAYEQKKRDEKFDVVKQIYDDSIGNSDMKDILPFERVFKESYLNSTTTKKTIINEMEDLRDRVCHDLETINADTGEYQFEMKQAYLRNLDMTEALQAKNAYEENARRKAEYEAQRKAAEEERIAKEKAEAERIAEAGAKKEEFIPPVVDEELDKKAFAHAEEKLVTIEFAVTGTVEQLKELKQYLKDNNYTYGPVQR